jgi:hypothetical protein
MDYATLVKKLALPARFTAPAAVRPRRRGPILAAVPVERRWDRHHAGAGRPARARPGHARAALRRGARAVIATPRGQNPAGGAVDDGRGRALRSVLAKHPSVLVIEDDYVASVAGSRDALAERGVEAAGKTGLDVWVPLADEAAAVCELLVQGWAVSPGERYRFRTAPGDSP